MTTFAQHFPPSEFQAASDRPLGRGELDYAALLSHRLELMRHAFGDRPLVITSYVRTAAETDTGNPSQHRDGSAVDVRRPDWMSWGELVLRVQALQHAGLTWGQFIIYPYETPRQHFHISLPTGAARQQLTVKTGPQSYVPFSQQLAQGFPGEPVVRPDVTVVGGAPAPAAGGSGRGNAALVAVAGGVAAAAALGALRGSNT